MFRPIYLLPILFALAFQPIKGESTVWKFGIIGDTHNSPPKKSNAGVALSYIKLVNSEFIRHGVDFVVQCGDLADAQGGQDKEGFPVRFRANEDLRKAGIPFYALRGNHDTGNMRNEQMKTYFLPGKKGGKKPKGYVQNGLNYGFRHKNASLYFLDIDNSLNPKKLIEWSNWMASFRKKENRPPHCIVFTHRNLHVPMSFRECLFGRKNDDSPDAQNVFYKNLVDSGTGLFVTAHLHMHLRGSAVSPDGKHSVNTMICAPCGEKVFPINFPLPMEEGDRTKEFFTNCYGYYIVTVSDKDIQIKFYSAPTTGKDKNPPSNTFKLKDNWTIPVPVLLAQQEKEKDPAAK